MWLIFGSGTIFIVSSSLLPAFGFLAVLNALTRGTPSVAIMESGFTARSLVGQKAYSWADIDGEFAVHNRLILQLVVFRVTVSCQQKLKRTPMAPCPGYHDGFGGSYQISIAELVTLLNQHRTRFAEAQPNGHKGTS
jgi:hypothetical protein